MRTLSFALLASVPLLACSSGDDEQPTTPAVPLHLASKPTPVATPVTVPIDLASDGTTHYLLSEPSPGAMFVVEKISDGHQAWVKTFGEGSGKGDGGPSGGQIVLAPDGHLVVSGGYFGTPTMGGVALPATGAGRNGFLVELDGDGGVVWSRSFGTSDVHSDGSPKDGSVDRIAFSPDGTVVFVSQFEGSVDFGAGPLASDTGSALVKVSLADGSTVWSTIVDGQSSGGLAVSQTGTIGFENLIHGERGVDVAISEVDANGAVVSSNDMLWGGLPGDVAFTGEVLFATAQISGPGFPPNDNGSKSDTIVSINRIPVEGESSAYGPAGAATDPHLAISATGQVFVADVWGPSSIEGRATGGLVEVREERSQILVNQKVYSDPGSATIARLVATPNGLFVAGAITVFDRHGALVGVKGMLERVAQ